MLHHQKWIQIFIVVFFVLEFVFWLKEFDTSAYPIFDRQNMLVSLYDEIIELIWYIIDRLDSSIEKEKFEVMKMKDLFHYFRLHLGGR